MEHFEKLRCLGRGAQVRATSSRFSRTGHPLPSAEFVPVLAQP